MLYWIWLSLSVTPGSNTFKNVLTKYSDAHAVYDLDEESLRRLVGSKSKDLEALLDKLRMIDGVKRLEVLGQV